MHRDASSKVSMIESSDPRKAGLGTQQNRDVDHT